MGEINRLSVSNDAIKLDFVEREATPKELMELAIHLHLGGLLLFYTISILDEFAVSRSRLTAHNWKQKADLEPHAGRDTEKIVLDKTLVKVYGEQFWLVTAVEPDTNVILHVGHCPFRNTALTKMFLRRHRENTKSKLSNFLWMSHPGYKRDTRVWYGLPPRNFGKRNSVEHVFQKIKRRTNYFTISSLDPQQNQRKTGSNLSLGSGNSLSERYQVFMNRFIGIHSEKQPMLEQIGDAESIYSIIIRSDYTSEGIHFFTPSNFSQQLGFMNRPEGDVVEPHTHKEVLRKVERTQEVLLVRKGRVRANIYDDNGESVDSIILESGDVILLAAGGHGFEMLEDTEMIEVKQGPYAGDDDKQAINTDR